MTAPPALTAEVVSASDPRVRARGKVSYVCGPTDEPLRFMTLSQVFDETVVGFGARAAAIFSAERQVLTWSDLKRESDQVALSLMALGIQRGDRVGILSTNRCEWLLALFGAARIGAVLVNIDTSCEPASLDSVLNQVRCSALFMARAAGANDFIGMIRGLAPELDRPVAKPVLESRRLPHLKHVIVLGEGLVPACARRFSDFVCLGGASQKRRMPALMAALDADDAINIQFTSGTTGPPKGTTLSHFNVVNIARGAAQALELTEADRLCIAVPLHQGLGMVLGVLSCVSVGATMVFPGDRFDAQQTLDAVSRHRCTTLHGTPTLFAALLSHPDRSLYETSSLRTGIIAGASCSAGLMSGVIEELHMDQVTVAYGSAEAGPLSFQSGMDDPFERRVETVGRIHAHLEAKIVGPDGKIVPIGAVGELCCRGYSVMRGYWDDPRRSTEVLDDAGWLHTGDLATFNAEGYCRIVGRLGETLVCGGRTVYPHEIEAVIGSHPKVRAVQVFGVPDVERGEDICAWIVLEPGESAQPEEILNHCRRRGVKDGLPRHIRFVAEFPLTTSGDAKKYMMRAAMVRQLEHTSRRSA
jgi:fatty-acyl-CoA synthase